MLVQREVSVGEGSLQSSVTPSFFPVAPINELISQAKLLATWPGMGFPFPLQFNTNCKKT